jgi:hypothetical protein
LFNDADPRKVFPQYGEGPLVKVGWAPNQAAAELMAGLLLEEGIPSIAKRAGGFDVPDFLAAGPRDIYVAASGVDNALDILGSHPTYERDDTPRAPAPAWVRALAILLVVVTVGLVLAGVVIAIV